MPSSYQVVLWKQESFVVLRPLHIEFFRNLLEWHPWCRHVPALRQELLDGTFLNAFLHTQFVVQEMVGNGSRAAIYIMINAVDANAIALAIGADQAHFQISLSGFPDGGFGSWRQD
jgi:hypothetical protein